MVVGALTALMAGLMAVVAGDIKRVLAYSTISQLGYMVYAVGCGAIFASQFHLLSHAIFKALLFLTAGAIITAVDTRDLLKMGGLGKKMPVVCVAFIIGSFGLVGLPIANGFFSKELILEEGLESGPLALYLIMLAGAGITALYTMRLNWLIFAGQPRGPKPKHDGLPAMRVSLGLLAFGTLTSWLLAGGLGQLFAETLPFHQIEGEETLTIVSNIFTAPATWITLAFILLSGAVWFGRSKLITLERVFKPILEHDFGFEWLQSQIINLVQRSATLLQRTQTGQLNWNVAGILIGLLVILIILAGGLVS
jgi:NADH-quinone oxidoreductase subunit L